MKFLRYIGLNICKCLNFKQIVIIDELIVWWNPIDSREIVREKS